MIALNSKYNFHWIATILFDTDLPGAQKMDNRAAIGYAHQTMTCLGLTGTMAIARTSPGSLAGRLKTEAAKSRNLQQHNDALSELDLKESYRSHGTGMQGILLESGVLSLSSQTAEREC